LLAGEIVSPVERNVVDDRVPAGVA
jgi:hypothetical protein